MEQSGEDAVKMAAHVVFLLINPEGGVRALGVGSRKKKGAEKKNNWRKEV